MSENKNDNNINGTAAAADEVHGAGIFFERYSSGIKSPGEREDTFASFSQINQIVEGSNFIFCVLN